MIKEKAKFAWFRDYKDVRAEFEKLLITGRALHRTILNLKRDRTRALKTELQGIRERVDALHRTTEFLNEGRLARSSLTRAEIAASQALVLLDKEKYDGAAQKIAEAEDFFRDGQETLLSLLTRYFDPGQVGAWRRMAEETLAESRSKGNTVILVSKLERELTVYRSAKPVAVCSIGLGRFSLSAKLHSGDSATPEGRYRITKKLKWSKFYKALMLNYPNDEDRRNFSKAKKRGLLPAGALIGGLIEIHGGGTDGLTEGCVGVANETMDKLFELADIGTAVTIIGTLKSEAEILRFLNLEGSDGR